MLFETAEDQVDNYRSKRKKFSFSDEVRAKISQSKMGHEVSEETRKKMSESIKNSKKHKYASFKYGLYVTGKPRPKISNEHARAAWTPELRKKVGDFNRHPKSEETKKRISEGMRRARAERLKTLYTEKMTQK
jgi:hypothetical protein